MLSYRGNICWFWELCFMELIRIACNIARNILSNTSFKHFFNEFNNLLKTAKSRKRMIKKKCSKLKSMLHNICRQQYWLHFSDGFLYFLNRFLQFCLITWPWRWHNYIIPNRTRFHYGAGFFVKFVDGISFSIQTA